MTTYREHKTRLSPWTCDVILESRKRVAMKRFLRRELIPIDNNASTDVLRALTKSVKRNIVRNA